MRAPPMPLGERGVNLAEGGKGYLGLYVTAGFGVREGE